MEVGGEEFDGIRCGVVGEERSESSTQGGGLRVSETEVGVGAAGGAGGDGGTGNRIGMGNRIGSGEAQDGSSRQEEGREVHGEERGGLGFRVSVERVTGVEICRREEIREQ